MGLRRVIYVSRIALPNTHAHSIQMMRTCHAVARQGVQVDFYVRGAPAPSLAELFGFYGLEPLEGFRIHWLAPEQWEGPRFLATVATRLRKDRSGTVIYTRDYHLARRLLRLRFLLRMPVLLETHKRAGYFEIGYVAADAPRALPIADCRLPNEEGCVLAGPGGGSAIGNRRSEIGNPQAASSALDETRRTDRFELIDYAYRHANGVVSMWADTARLVAERYPATPVLHLWVDTEPLPELTYDPAARQGVYYVGNLYPHYRPEVLLDALRQIEGETLHVIGGNDEAHVAALRRLAAERGVGGRVVLEGYVAPGRVQSLFGRFRVAVALLPGLKLAGYFSNGIPFVAPRLPVAQDLLRDGETCLLFEPLNADSMASALRRILADDALARRLAAGALAEARKHASPDRARRLIAFIEGLL